MMWLIFGLMGIGALAFMVLPIVKGSRVLPAAVIVLSVALTAGLYAIVGSPGTPSGAGQAADAGQLPDIGAMVEGLAARLEQNPDDVEGWKMLGRSYMQLGNPQGAVEAFEKAVELTSGQDAQSLVDLGEAYLSANNQQMTTRESMIFENAVRVDPENQAALFWGGIAAANREETELAATRWEKLLRSDPPPSPEVAQVLSGKIAEWRGQPAAAAALIPATPEAANNAGGIRLTVALSDAARADLPASASVFVIARDPAQPSPPIAVQRRVLSELPTALTLSDRDAMIPGRNLSNFEQVEVIARASVSGNPIQQTGDWFVMSTVATNSDDVIDLVISERAN